MMELVETLMGAALGETPLERVMLVGMSLWIWSQQRQLFRVQEKRVESAMKLADAAHTFSGALDRNTATLRALMEE